MRPRIHYAQHAPGIYDAMDGLDRYLERCSLEAGLLHLVRLRASQLNGCAYCIDMHWQDSRALGAEERRLYALDAWRECPWYSPRERAALAWTEAVTQITDGHAPDETFAALAAHFSAPEIADLTCAVATINAWNRLSIAARLTPGTYQPAATAS